MRGPIDRRLNRARMRIGRIICNDQSGGRHIYADGIPAPCSRGGKSIMPATRIVQLAYLLTLTLATLGGCHPDADAERRDQRIRLPSTGGDARPANDRVPNPTPYDKTSMQPDGTYRGAPDAGAPGRLNIDRESGGDGPASTGSPPSPMSSKPRNSAENGSSLDNPRPDHRQDAAGRVSPRSGRTDSVGTFQPAHDDSVRVTEELGGGRHAGGPAGSAAPPPSSGTGGSDASGADTPGRSTPGRSTPASDSRSGTRSDRPSPPR